MIRNTNRQPQTKQWDAVLCWVVVPWQANTCDQSLMLPAMCGNEMSLYQKLSSACQNVAKANAMSKCQMHKGYLLHQKPELLGQL
jgi:uncharacterized CHY-type Zn-finger protein